MLRSALKMLANSRDALSLSSIFQSSMPMPSSPPGGEFDQAAFRSYDHAASCFGLFFEPLGRPRLRLSIDCCSYDGDATIAATSLGLFLDPGGLPRLGFGGSTDSSFLFLEPGGRPRLRFVNCSTGGLAISYDLPTAGDASADSIIALRQSILLSACFSRRQGMQRTSVSGLPQTFCPQLGQVKSQPVFNTAGFPGNGTPCARTGTL
jgi:hypothetical protein